VRSKQQQQHEKDNKSKQIWNHPASIDKAYDREFPIVKVFSSLWYVDIVSIVAKECSKEGHFPIVEAKLLFKLIDFEIMNSFCKVYTGNHV